MRVWILVVALGWVVCSCSEAGDDDTSADDDDATADDDDDVTADDDDATADDDDDDATGDDDDSSGTGSDLLANFPDPCKQWTAVMPLSGEEGQLAASRLTPPHWPFSVDKVVYQLLHGDQDGVQCNAEYPHRVELFTAEGPAPAAVPADVLVVVTEEDEVQGTERIVVVDLDPPITLEQDEDLFVAVELTGNYPDVGCLSMCTDGVTHDDRNYWSNANEAPYSWAELSGYGVMGNLVVVAYGVE
jgi:hypothetical protein